MRTNVEFEFTQFLQILQFGGNEFPGSVLDVAIFVVDLYRFEILTFLQELLDALLVFLFLGLFTKLYFEAVYLLCIAFY